MGQMLAGQEPIKPKSGARFHFELPGSVQGFQVREGSLTLRNVDGHSQHAHRG